MMDLVCEDNLLEVLEDSPGCCIFSPLCRFCRNSKIKCYIQEKVFVGWCNFYLNLVGDDIETVTQLWDWTCFVSLLNGLSQERQLLSENVCETEAGFHQNWDIVQDYLIKEKVVKSVLMNGRAVVVRKKFTFWLIEILWSLIFRHHFNLTTVKMSRRPSIDYRKASNSLLKWIKRKMPGSKVNDLLFDLNDGVTLCQLVNAIAPRSIDQCLFKGDVDAESIVSYAMQAAKDVLGIPSLISAEEIVEGNADEKSLITYLALFRSADRMLARGIRPISPRHISNGGCINGDAHTTTNRRYPQHRVNRRSPANQSIAYGFGIRYGEVGKPTEFIVHLNGSKSDLSVSIKCSPDNEQSSYLKAQPKIKSVGESSYIVSYTPIRSGDYEISVLCGRKHILNSPFKINIKNPIVSFKCIEELDHHLSIEPVNHLSDSDYLLLSEDSGSSPCSPDKDINGNLIPIKSDSFGTVNSVNERSEMFDRSSNNVFFNDSRELHMNGDYIMPESATESSSSSQDVSECIAYGRGLSSGEVGVMSHFEVQTSDRTNGPLSVLVTCPAMSIPTPHVNTRVEEDLLVHDVMYLPTEPGTYEIEIKWGNKFISGSPYRAVVKETNTLHSNSRQQSVAEVFSNEVSGARSVVIFYSATSCDKNHQRHRDYLESLLCGTIEKPHVVNVPADLELSAGQRMKLFEITKDRKMPFVFLDRQFLGSYETVVGLYRTGNLKERIEELVGGMPICDYDLSNFIDVQIINDIKMTLNELKNPPISKSNSNPTTSDLYKLR